MLFRKIFWGDLHLSPEPSAVSTTGPGGGLPAAPAA